MKHLLLLYLITWGIFLTIGDIFLKKWSIDYKYLYYGFGMVAYVIGIILFSLTLREKWLAVANTILQTTNIAFLAIISYFFFHEHLTPIQMVGIALSILSVVLLEFGG